MNEHDRAALAARMINDLLEVFRDAPLEGGDGDLWFIGSLHGPGMAPTQSLSFNTLSNGEGVQATLLLAQHFRDEQFTELSRIEDLGFDAAEVNMLGQVLVMRRHLDPDSAPAEMLGWLDEMLMTGVPAHVERIRSLMRDIADEMATANLANLASWGSPTGQQVKEFNAQEG